jgi:hypothetical protein
MTRFRRCDSESPGVARASLDSCTGAEGPTGSTPAARSPSIEWPEAALPRRCGERRRRSIPETHNGRRAAQPVGPAMGGSWRRSRGRWIDVEREDGPVAGADNLRREAAVGQITSQKPLADGAGHTFLKPTGRVEGYVIAGLL